jgi:hypothetical protein
MRNARALRAKWVERFCAEHAQDWCKEYYRALAYASDRGGLLSSWYVDSPEPRLHARAVELAEYSCDYIPKR